MWIQGWHRGGSGVSRDASAIVILDPTLRKRDLTELGKLIMYDLPILRVENAREEKKRNGMRVIGHTEKAWQSLYGTKNRAIYSALCIKTSLSRR